MFRPSVIASLGFAAAAAAAVLAFSLDSDEPADLPPPQVAGGPVQAGLRAESGRPVVEVVRVGDGGDAMIAGRAAPKAEIALFADDRELGRVVADARGEWVFVPSLPFGAGAWRLTLKGEGGDGDVPVVLVVPEAGQGGAFAFTSAPGQASKMLLAPSDGEAGSTLAITLVDHDRDGHLFVSGRAESGATIQIYLDNRFVGRARADAAGNWLVAARVPGRGTHALRADRIDARGKVLLRAEREWRSGDDLVASAPVLAVKEADDGWRVVSRGDGGGLAYATVYPAGHGQLRDPERTYPGQVVSGKAP